MKIKTWDAAKAMPKEKYIAVDACIKKRRNISNHQPNFIT